MYFRNPDHIDVDWLVRAARAVPDPKPLSLPDRLVLSVGMIAAPAAAILLTLGIGQLAGVL